MNDADKGNTALRADLAAMAGEMMYLSESEAGLELLPPDAGLCSQESVRAALPEETREQSGADFLMKMKQETDPADTMLTTYFDRWQELFQKLDACCGDVRVYRSGSDPVEIRIVAVANAEAIVLKTAAVET